MPRESRRRSILCGRKSWRYIMARTKREKKRKWKEKKRTRKNHAESSVTLKSICHHILLTHRDRCSLNAILSETDTHTTKQTNHYTNPPSWEKRYKSCLFPALIKDFFFLNVSVCCWNEVTSRLLERHGCSYKIIWTDEKLPGYISAEAYWLTLLCSLFITNFIGQYKTSFGHPGFNGVH